MGWEWHNRPHDEKGRWLKKHARGKVDIHIRIDRADADRMREMAAAQHMEIGEYLEHVLRDRWTADETIQEFTGRSLRSGMSEGGGGPAAAEAAGAAEAEGPTPEMVVDAALDAMREYIDGCPDKPVHYYCRDSGDFENDACEQCWRDYLLRQG